MMMLVTRGRKLAFGAALLVGSLALGPALLAPAELRAEDVGREPAKDASMPQAAVDRAIGKVYPALVLIHVLEFTHSAGHERKALAAGSGAIISPDGYVVTNHHVAGKAASIRVTLSSKEEIDATLVGTDALADIAILKIDVSSRAKDAPPLPVASWGPSAALKVGDPVLAMGCPRALSQSVTKGIVANKNMMMPRLFGESFMLDGEDVGSLVQWIGHDAMIQPGNSGGPLVNLEGQIIGINEIGIGTMSGAIPSEIAEQVARELIAHGKVRRTWIGAEFQPLLRENAALPSPDAKGVLVGGVLPGSPAEQGGLKPGDLVLALDGTPVQVRMREDMPAWNRLLLGKPVGSEIALLVKRGEKDLTVKVTTDLRDDAEGKEIESKEWGVTAREITTPVAKELQRDKKGVLVGSIRQGGPCDKAQPAIAQGDVITGAAGKPVEDLAGFQKVTAEITAGHSDPVPTVVSFERGSEKFLTLVEIGVRKPQDPASEAKHPWLAVDTQVLSKKLAAALGLKGKKGVRICEIYPDSDAAAAGFQVGDIVTQIDGNPIEASEPHDARVFEEMIRAYKVGSKAVFNVFRGTEKLEVTATLNAAPAPESELKELEDAVLEWKGRDVSYFDRIRHRWAKDQGGVLVTNVESGGWAYVAGLAAGDLVLELDGKAVANVSDLDARLKALHDQQARHLALLVRRGIHTRFIELEPRKRAESGK